MTVPWSIDELTPQWFSAALGRQIDTVECRTFAEGVGMLSVMVQASLTTPAPIPARSINSWVQRLRTPRP